MKLIVGLGNPGEEYAATRHNVGFRVVERLAERHRLALGERAYKGLAARGRIGPNDVVLLEPQTYMNLSGEAVKAAVSHLKVGGTDVLVVHDEVDFPLGVVRVKQGGGDGGHRGIRSILTELGKDDFTRVRIGVGRPRPRGGVTDWVLEAFDEDEAELLEDTLATATQAAEVWLRQGTLAAMNRFNRRKPPEPIRPAGGGANGRDD